YGINTKTGLLSIRCGYLDQDLSRFVRSPKATGYHRDDGVGHTRVIFIVLNDKSRTNLRTFPPEYGQSTRTTSPRVMLMDLSVGQDHCRYPFRDRPSLLWLRRHPLEDRLAEYRAPAEDVP